MPSASEAALGTYPDCDLSILTLDWIQSYGLKREVLVAKQVAQLHN
jgi:hypothetical protein